MVGCCKVGIYLVAKIKCHSVRAEGYYIVGYQRAYTCNASQ